MSSIESKNGIQKTNVLLLGVANLDRWYTDDHSDYIFQGNHNPEEKCEWQDSNLRTPSRIDLESITFGRSVTLAPVPLEPQK